MAVTTEIPWDDGSGDKIYLTRNASKGDQVVQVSSDANSGAARTKVVTFTSGVGNIQRQLTINQAAGGGGGIGDYVQSGLVMHLDGIDKGNTSGRWESLVGNTYYTLNSHSAVENNAVVMDGAGVISGTNSVHVAWASGTIEVCYEILSSARGVCIYAGSSGLGLTISGSAYAFGIGAGSSAKNQWTYGSNVPTLATISVNTNRLKVNGNTIAGTKVSNNWGSANSACPIGGRTSGTKYYMNIRIHSIRKYNRLLTEAEMLQNQKVDNIRFGLGLSI